MRITNNFLGVVRLQADVLDILPENAAGCRAEIMRRMCTGEGFFRPLFEVNYDIVYPNVDQLFGAAMRDSRRSQAFRHSFVVVTSS